jgi:hypothetical protein
MNGKQINVLGHKLSDIHGEINRLRKRDGHEEIGGLSLALKLFSHFHEEHNPRVAEAFANLDGARKPPVASGPAAAE